MKTPNQKTGPIIGRTRALASVAAWILAFSCAGLLAPRAAHAQTTLTGDHVVTGNLNVGTSGTARSLTVTGSANIAGTVSLNGAVVTGTSNTAMSGGTVGSSEPWAPRDSTAMSGGFVGDESAGSTALSGGFLEGGNIGCVAMSGGFMWLGNWGSTAMSGGFIGWDGGANKVAMSNGYADYGDCATAIAGGTAYGGFSVAIGIETYCAAPECVVVGSRNVQAWTYEGESPTFIVGNGNGIEEDPNRYRNAIAVYKSGKVQITGDVKITKRQGDILMGEFGEEE